MSDPSAPPRTAAPPPRDLFVVGPKPQGSDYGYFETHPQPSTRQELEARLAEGRPTPFVWTPETVGLQPPWTVDYLFQAYRRHGLRHSRRVGLTWAGVGVAALVFAAAEGKFNFLNGFVVFGFIALAVSFYSIAEWVRFGRLTPDRMVVRVKEERTRPPARSGPPRYTMALVLAIAAVMVVQMVGSMLKHGGAFPIMFGTSVTGEGVDAAGVVRKMVSAEPWRLLSGALLHDGLLHFGMNMMALLALGRFIEAFGHRAYVPIVFLLTALASSAASFFFSHAPASVGASGGILGLFGFLAVMARRRREMMPPGFGRAILIDISVIAGIGLLGYGYVDNWAHAGGFASGAFLGWLMIPHGGRTAYWEPSRPIRVIGDVALGILMVAAAWTVGVLVHRLFIVG